MTFLQTGVYVSGLTGVSWLGWVPSYGGTFLSVSQASGLVTLRPLLLTGNSLPPSLRVWSGAQRAMVGRGSCPDAGPGAPCPLAPSLPTPPVLHAACSAVTPAVASDRLRRRQVSILAAPGAYEVPVLPLCFLPPLPSKPTHTSGAARSLEGSTSRYSPEVTLG